VDAAVVSAAQDDLKHARKLNCSQAGESKQGHTTGCWNGALSVGAGWTIGVEVLSLSYVAIGAQSGVLHTHAKLLILTSESRSQLNTRKCFAKGSSSHVLFTNVKNCTEMLDGKFDLPPLMTA
jgi:hypothetical protein